MMPRQFVRDFVIKLLVHPLTVRDNFKKKLIFFILLQYTINFTVQTIFSLNIQALCAWGGIS